MYATHSCRGVITTKPLLAEGSSGEDGSCTGRNRVQNTIWPTVGRLRVTLLRARSWRRYSGSTACVRCGSGIAHYHIKAIRAIPAGKVGGGRITIVKRVLVNCHTHDLRRHADPAHPLKSNNSKFITHVFIYLHVCWIFDFVFISELKTGHLNSAWTCGSLAIKSPT